MTEEKVVTILFWYILTNNSKSVRKYCFFKKEIIENFSAFEMREPLTQVVAICRDYLSTRTLIGLLNSVKSRRLYITRYFA